MAASFETINIINDLQFLNSVKDKGQYLFDKLAEIKEEFPQILEIRGKGLMVGIELNLSVEQLVEQFLKNGLIVGTAGPNVLRLLPPINLSYEEIDEAIQIMKQVFSSYFLDSQVK
jgi:acetylornithine aminotransferase